MKSSALLIVLLLQATVPQFIQVGEQTFEGDARLLFAADLESDGTQEILVWDAVTREVICYGCAGSPLWTFQTAAPLVAAAAEDLNGDNLKEIFLLEELESDTYYPYRIIRLESDGTVSWRKIIEINILTELQFHFVNVDGKPGKEIIIANRVILEGGLERLAFERDQLITGAAEYEDTSYFLVQNPDSGYALYTFDNEVVWQGQHCQMQGIQASMELLACTLFFEAGVCSCYEDWMFVQSEPLMKSVRLWTDLTGDGAEEAIYVTDTEVQLIDSQGSTVWTWKSPEFIEDLKILDMTGDGYSEIVIMTPSKGIHVPSLYVLDCTGSIQSVFALNLSGIPSVVFSDMDGDTDLDLITFSQARKSSLQIYANTHKEGLLDDLEPGTPLEVVDPSRLMTKFWTFWAAYRFVILIVIIAVAGILFMVKRKRKENK